MNLIISVIGLVICFLGFFQLLISPRVDKTTRKWALIFYIFLYIYISCNLTVQLSEGREGRVFFHIMKIFVFLEALFASTLIPMLTGFIIQCRGEKKYIFSYEMKVSYLIWLIHLFFLIFAQFSRVIYYIEEDNTYHQGALYPFLLAPTVIAMTWNMIVLLRSRKNLTKKDKIAFSLYLFLPTLAMILQMIFKNPFHIVLGTALSAFFMMTYVIMEQSERYYKQESENSKLKLDILVAQIKPHFIFNSLTVIKYLCKKDPEKTEKALSDFTSYLRYHMDSISADKPISFEEEMKHVKEYVSLQKLRFEDELNVEYDLKYTDFMIPTLTLQPVIENAITYGVRKSDNGSGTVKVSTERDEDNVKISVEDDGPGFEYDSAVSEDKSKSHTGINNIKERLEYISGGELLIESKFGKGTKVTIILPIKKVE